MDICAAAVTKDKFGGWKGKFCPWLLLFLLNLRVPRPCDTAGTSPPWLRKDIKSAAAFFFLVTFFQSLLSPACFPFWWKWFSLTSPDFHCAWSFQRRLYRQHFGSTIASSQHHGVPWIGRNLQSKGPLVPMTPSPSPSLPFQPNPTQPNPRLIPTCAPRRDGSCLSLYSWAHWNVGAGTLPQGAPAWLRAAVLPRAGLEIRETHIWQNIFVKSLSLASPTSLNNCFSFFVVISVHSSDTYPVQAVARYNLLNFLAKLGNVLFFFLFSPFIDSIDALSKI